MTTTEVDQRIVNAIAAYLRALRFLEREGVTIDHISNALAIDPRIVLKVVQECTFVGAKLEAAPGGLNMIGPYGPVNRYLVRLSK